MPSARELKMRQILEEKKQAILAKQQGAVATASSPTRKQNKPESPLEQSSQKQEAKPTKEITLRFQAIGIVYGQVRQEKEEEYYVDLDGRECRLWVAKAQQSGLSKTLEDESYLYLKVYPRVWLSPEGEAHIYLHLVHWLTQSSWAKSRWEEKVGLFIIRGIWQFHSQSKTEMMAVYRNHVAFDPTGLYKATYLPIEIKRSDVKAFNPKAKKKDKQPRRWFIQGHFRLNQEITKLIWIEDIAKPTRLLPKYKKPHRKSPKEEN